MTHNVIKCQQRSRLNEQGNEQGNEWECFTLKSLINLPPASLHGNTSVTVSQTLRCVDGPRQFIRWPCVPGAINPRPAPRPYLESGSFLSPCLPRFHKHNTPLDLLTLSFSSPPSLSLSLHFPRCVFSEAEPPVTAHSKHFLPVSSPWQLNMHTYPLFSG